MPQDVDVQVGGVAGQVHPSAQVTSEESADPFEKEAPGLPVEEGPAGQCPGQRGRDDPQADRAPVAPRVQATGQVTGHLPAAFGHPGGAGLLVRVVADDEVGEDLAIPEEPLHRVSLVSRVAADPPDGFPVGFPVRSDGQWGHGRQKTIILPVRKQYA